MPFQADAIFEAMSEGLKADSSVVDKMKAIFVYRLKAGSEQKVYTADLKNGKGEVYVGEPKSGKADVEFTMSDDDFAALVSKKANPQQLFMGGKMKLKGNMALAMKFEQVLKSMESAAPKAVTGGAKKAAPAAGGEKKAAAAATGGDSKSDFKSAAVFNQLGAALKAEPGLVDKMKSVFVYRLSKGGQTQVWTLDLKNGAGSLHQGEPKTGKADVEFTMSDDDFVALVSKKANPQQLFMGGKMKLKGNMALAMKFEQVLKALPSPKL